MTIDNPEKPENPGVSEEALTRHASSSAFSRVVLKGKGEFQGYIFREESKEKWCIAVGHNPYANILSQRPVYFDAAEVVLLETIVSKRGLA